MEAKNKLMIAFGWTRLKDNKEGNGEMLILAESQSTADFIKASNELASCLDCKMRGGSQNIVDYNQLELFFQDQVFLLQFDVSFAGFTGLLNVFGFAASLPAFYFSAFKHCLRLFVFFF